MTANAIVLGVQGFAALLVVAVLVSIAAERLRIPPAVALVAVGASVGTALHVRPPFEFAPTLLFVFLPPLIFEAAWNIDVRSLRAHLARVALLAFPGTVLTALLIALVLSRAGALPLGAALLFGAMVSATDPVAVVAVFRRVRIPLDLRTIVEAESLANDGVAVVLYGIALTIALGGTAAIGAATLQGAIAVAGGTAVGAGAAFAVAYVLRATSAAEFEVTATVALAYAAYLAADAAHCSGIFATAASAIALRFALRRDADVLNRGDDIDSFWNAAAFIVNALVFITTGLAIDATRIAHEPLLIATALVVITVARAILALAAARRPAARVTIFLAGMRGALPLALALSLPAQLPQRAEILDAVFATVLVTLVVQGIPLELVVRRLYAPSPRPAAES